MTKANNIKAALKQKLIRTGMLLFAIDPKSKKAIDVAKLSKDGDFVSLVDEQIYKSPTNWIMVTATRVLLFCN